MRLEDSFRTSTSINFPPTPTSANLVIVSDNNNLIRRFFFRFSGSLASPSLIQIDSNKHVCCLVGLLCNDSKLRDCRWWWAACFRDFTRSWLPVFCKKSVTVCHYQDDEEACKSVHVVGYANPNPTELFRLATLFITSHLVFFGSVPYLQHEEIFGIVSSYCNPLCWDMVGWKRFRANNTTKTNASTSQASWELWKTSPTRLSPSLPVITK